uniref:Small ribosomal subunit protein mS33 n=2 Tax=Ditylum brightwellii TaxID=49249 RepID=A0A6U3RDU9_9STRA|mmetsp:Transcript_24233/g.36144  ORF Transcript_24233/g.36144 Transcript_24233/m.36144 type:complete len:100 (+) Transcript_24233:247-546(+)
MASKAALDKVRKEIFGNIPVRNMRTGNQVLRKPDVGPYLAKYYMESMDKSARKAWQTFGYMPPYTTELQERRLLKNEKLRMKGKGAPKKGAGKRATKGK